MTPAEQLLAADQTTVREGHENQLMELSSHTKKIAEQMKKNLNAAADDLEVQSEDSYISQIKHYKSRREERLARKAK